MDNRKAVKEFINYICDWIEYEYTKEGHDNYGYDLRSDILSYLVADKGIDKRIQKQLFKRLGLKSKVDYKLNISEYTYPNGELRIKLYKEKVN